MPFGPFPAHNLIVQGSGDAPSLPNLKMSHYDDDDFWSTGPAEDRSVCRRCFGDIDISDFIESRVNSRQCDFCRRKSKTREIAAPLEEVVEFMADAINREYERAVDALGWESAEGGFLGEHFDSEELLADWIGLELPKDDDGRLLAVLVNCFGDEPWCQRDPYSLRPDELLKFSWERFCDFVKHERRYFFLHKQAEKPSHEYLTPSQILGVVSKAAREHELVKMLPAGSLIYRARQQKPRRILSSPYDFGPPAVEQAIRSNRMSPAGIVMFYGSDDKKTAVAEIDDDPHLGIVVGTFRTTRPSAILDLTALPRRLRFFEHQPDSSSVDRYALDFLHSFVKSLAAKVEKSEREHVDYVPTQVVTEYFRTTFRHEGSLIDGVRYFSAQQKGGKSVVLFADQESVVLKPSQIKRLARSGANQNGELQRRQDGAWLELVRKRVIRLPELPPE